MVGVLEGIRVIDLTQNVAGPFCSQILGDLGAEIVKIERPAGGDDTRQWRPPEIDGWSSTFLALNRNKRSIGVDLDTEGGLRVVRDLARGADVMIHSFKPGSAESRGLGSATVRALNPALVYCAISAFGQCGPLAGLPGYDPLLQAFTGIMSVTGSEGQEPVRVGVSLIDMGTGLWSALGIVGALLRRKETGVGALVETSLLETGISWMTVPAASYVATGAVPGRMGSAMAMTAPYELFRTSDGNVFIGAGNDRLFRAVCTGLDCHWLADDERYATNPARVRNRASLHAAIEEITARRTAAEIVAALREVGAPCSELNDIAAALSNPQVTATGIAQLLPLEQAPDHCVISVPLKIDGNRAIPPKAPPGLGQDTDAILSGLGYSTEDVARLRNCGAVA